ncbi:hypothetical protein NPIL_173331 [Nephila pilipes]|uniref:Uncharacterized protein n=1 Tax=Nephila pilipes TaxID=299642 RepID=A0A8X6QIA9_NEPPI|nr:hypothetical protein NPIL_173331 [Nephila pilipes]
MWREFGMRNFPFSITECERFDRIDEIVQVNGEIMIDERTPLNVLNRGYITGHRYRNETLQPYVKYFTGVYGSDFLFMMVMLIDIEPTSLTNSLKAKPFSKCWAYGYFYTLITEPEKSSDLNPIEISKYYLEKAVARRYLPPTDILNAL